MMKSDAEANAVVFAREHAVPADVRAECPELADAIETYVAEAVEAVEAVRHGENPVLADEQLRQKLLNWTDDYAREKLLRALQATQDARGQVHAV